MALKLKATHTGRCAVCGCTEFDACPAGCGWAVANLCTVCWKLRTALEGFVDEARSATQAGVLRLFRDVVNDRRT